MWELAKRYPVPALVLAGVAVLAAWSALRGMKQVGQDVAGAGADLATGLLTGTLELAPTVVGDTATGFASWANSDANPLKPFGDWLGSSLYDWTH